MELRRYFLIEDAYEPTKVNKEILVQENEPEVSLFCLRMLTFIVAEFEILELTYGWVYATMGS